MAGWIDERDWDAARLPHCPECGVSVLGDVYLCEHGVIDARLPGCSFTIVDIDLDTWAAFVYGFDGLDKMDAS